MHSANTAQAGPAPRRAASRTHATVLALLGGLCGACTSVGVHAPTRHALDYGPPMQLRVCVLQAEGVSTDRVDKLIGAVNREFAAYGIEVVVPWVRPWQRAGFGHEALFDDVARRELEAPCDRLVAFVDRNAADFFWGLALPEVLGSVDDATHTRGFVVANRASINQLFMPPGKVVVHEFYHLLGCPHAGSLSQCYGRIARLKREARAGFFPGVDRHGMPLVSREQVNRTLQQALAAH